MWDWSGRDVDWFGGTAALSAPIGEPFCGSPGRVSDFEEGGDGSCVYVDVAFAVVDIGGERFVKGDFEGFRMVMTNEVRTGRVGG